MLFRKKPAKQYVALDIGSKNTKFMAFEPGKAHISKFIIQPTPEGAFEGGAVTDEEALINFLSQRAVELELESDLNVIAGVSGKGVIIKKIDIPQMEESMIPEFVEIEAEQEIFYNKDEMDLDYNILEGVNFKKPGAPSLLVVTALKKIIEDYNNVITKSFMNCEILDINAAALFNSFEHNFKMNDKKRYMLIDIGGVSTNFVIIIKNQVVFARNIQMGGDFFNQGIQKAMGIDYAEAESLKIGASQGGEAPQELIDLIQKNLNEAFGEEFFAGYELYHSLFPENEVHQAYITGGASQTIGLAEHLEKKLGFSVEPFNPFQNISLSPNLKTSADQLKMFSAAASGLALRSLEC